MVTINSNPNLQPKTFPHHTHTNAHTPQPKTMYQPTNQPTNPQRSRKLNSQLERAIQEAMTELDNISASATATSTPASAVIGQQLQQPQQPQHPTSTNSTSNGVVRGKRTGAGMPSGQTSIGGASVTLTASTAATLSGLFSQQRAKPIRIAPAPPAPTGVPAAAAGASPEILKLAK